MRRPLSILLLVACGAPPVLAWKSKLQKWGIYVNKSVHQPQTVRAVEILRAYNPSDEIEWTRFENVLIEASGSVNGDANSHGNVIFQDERVDPTGQAPVSTDSMAYDGGPFYRWWIRLQESHAQVNTGVDLFKRRIPSPRVRSAATPYRYMGYMAHLVQDNCSPAHAANIRQGVYEGVEYWHWESLAWGGSGQDHPRESESILLAEMDGDGHALGGLLRDLPGERPSIEPNRHQT